ncbi:MAG: saccharopine dehydrogenase family protein [Phycisphaerales bacterium JB039]
MKAVVLGAGMVGRVIAADLAEDFEVTLADNRTDALESAARHAGRPIRTIAADLSDPRALADLIAGADVVAGALASGLGFQTLRTLIECGRPYCDISFMPQNAWELDEMARARGLTAIVDCGVAPGMSNLLAGFGAARLDTCERIEIYVGGLPRQRRWPFQYKAAFSPADVIEEYTRPARLVEHGQVVEREALSEPELMDFDGVGTLEAFNTDGLRSLAYTMDAPFMKEKTLRYPGHIELMRVLRATGLFGSEPVAIGDSAVRPLDLLSALMFPMWSYEEGEEDLTVMRIIVEGERAGARRRLSWDLLDFYDRQLQRTSMARTTAYPCAILARMLAEGSLRRPGVITPEQLGPDQALVDRVLAEHERRGVRYIGRDETL